ncbi:MAG TPA: 7-cyano-7-deazaguanine synthase QueC [Hyphomicrobiaceae bacterium]|nr:7-cyano-7-deazaguanine synthase QueC [Hyphomicrobiaceae bacterium]
MQTTTALVLLSGGLDSTVCLAWALERYRTVETIGFDYGQRNKVELSARKKVLTEMKKRFADWRKRLGPDHVMDISSFGRMLDSALTRDKPIEARPGQLPTTFVPGRNLLFFTCAAAVAYPRDITTLIGGMCETDYSGYPDCRYGTLQALQKALSLGMEKEFRIEAPLMWIDKADTFKLARELGGEAFVELIVEETHSCYLDVRSQRHAWGYGCNRCPACELRRKGWEAWRSAPS